MKISIRGPIVSSNTHRFYQFYGMEATSPKSVADALAKGAGERAEVEINSGGGEIFAASEIYTALRNYAGGVHIRIVGLAASAASIIAMAGESEMTPTGMMMIHNVQTSADGDYRQMEHTAGVPGRQPRDHVGVHGKDREARAGNCRHDGCRNVDHGRQGGGAGTH